MLHLTLMSALSWSLVASPDPCPPPVPRHDSQVSVRVLPFTLRLLTRKCAGANGTVTVRGGEVLLGSWSFAHWHHRTIRRR